MKKPIITVIESNMFKGGQSAEFREIYTLELGDKKFKVKIEIDRDSVAFQSSATGKVWNQATLKWELVYSIHYTLMKTSKNAIYNLLHRGVFAEDIKTIQEKVNSILF